MMAQEARMNKKGSKGSVYRQPELLKTTSRSSVYDLARTASRSTHDLSNTLLRGSTNELSKFGEVGMSRTNLHESKPVLAPFASGANYSTLSLAANNVPQSGYATPSKGAKSSGISGLNRELYTSSVFNRYLNNADKTQSAFSLPSSPNAPINPRTATPRSVRSSASPQITVENEFGSPVTMDEGDEAEITQDTVDQLKNSLAYDVVLRLNTAETGLESRIDEFDRSLQELNDLRSRSSLLVDKFEAYSHRTEDEVETQISSIRSIRTEFSKVDEYEKRVDSARKRVQEFKKRLAQINSRISEQEMDNRKRKLRIKYAKQGTLAGALLIVVLILLIRTYLLNCQNAARQMDFDELIDCLTNIDACPY